MGFPTQSSSLQLFFRKHPLGSCSAVLARCTPHAGHHATEEGVFEAVSGYVCCRTAGERVLIPADGSAIRFILEFFPGFFLSPTNPESPAV